jgi:hypothetical protein
MVRTTLIGVLLTGTCCLYGQPSSASQTVYLRVLSSSSLALTGQPSLTVQDAEAGDDLLQAEDRSSSYRLSTNRPTLKLSAAMSEPLPDGMRLFVNAGSALGVSVGDVELSDAIAPATIVSSIGKGVDTDQPIAYRLLVDAEAVRPASLQRRVIFTLTD